MNTGLLEQTCDACKKPQSECVCQLLSLVRELGELKDEPIPCSICEERKVVKYGACQQCLDYYGLGDDDNMIEEDPVVEGFASSCAEIMAEEELETQDPDLGMDLDDDFDDFDDDFDEDVEDDFTDEEEEEDFFEDDEEDFEEDDEPEYEEDFFDEEDD